MLELRHVTRTYGPTAALSDISIAVPKGALVTLLGPSGCGKSTALNCIAGLTDLTSGEIRLDGVRIDQLPAERRRFGMVFQSYALFPHLTVYRNAAFGLELLGLKKKDLQPKVSAALRLMRLEELKDRFPWELSGGQQQRLAFARAIVLEPKLLLLDEPLSNLDAKLRDELRIEIRKLHDRLGLTTVHVTHDQTEAMTMSDVVVVMRAGRIEQAGSPEDIYSRPASLFVADFMGYRNRLSLEVSHADHAGVRLRGRGIDLTAHGRFDLRPGQRAIACFRPDDTRIGATGALSAEVAIVEYLGRTYSAEARLHDHDASVHLHHAEPLTRGQPVKINVPPDRLMVYAE